MTTQTILNPIQKFIKTESFGGYLLFFATVLALVIANSPLAHYYTSFLSFEVGVQTETFGLVKPLILWINDGFMAVFFFLIGLEIKREILIGELNSIQKASLPIFAAIGGMVMPMLFYFLFNSSPETADGWGISMATDIAFSLAVLQLLGSRVPLGLKIFLTAFAIIDDLGAVLIIAFFYTSEISWGLIGIAGIGLSFLYVLSYLRIHNKFFIVIIGVAVWVLFLKSGIHPTIAGVLLAFAIPIRQKINEFEYAGRLNDIVSRITKLDNTNPLPILTKKQIEEIDNLEDWTYKVQSPLQQLEHHLHNWVAYFIMPVFAFANAGVVFSDMASIDWSLASTITIALVGGKTVGVFLFTYLSVKLRFAKLPDSVDYLHVLGIAILSGIGFTMSLFIGNLAFEGADALLNSSKVGVLAGSISAGVIGYLILRMQRKQK